jgi:hypothetical protein
MSGITDMPKNDPFMSSFLKYIETATQEETEKIMESYKEKMITDLESARLDIIAKASIRLSEHMTVQDLGRTLRIEIVKDTK